MRNSIRSEMDCKLFFEYFLYAIRKARRIKGLAKKKGGIGLHVTSATKRTFKPNLQRVRIKDENGTIKRVWISAKALKSGKVKKA